MRLRLGIAGMFFEVISRDMFMLQKFKPFIYDFEEEADVIVNLNACRYISKPEGNSLLLVENMEWLREHDNGSVMVCMYGMMTGKTLCLLTSDSNWSRINISYLEDCPDIDYIVTGIMFNIIIRSRVLFHNGIVIHASAIEYDGKGIAFSAPSGTGKSTQASLWESHLEARVINDDCPVIKIDDGHPHAYGTPCSGSVDKFLNLRLPLTAVVMIEQARENSIRRLSKAEAISYLMPRCFIAYHDEGLTDMAINTLESIISAVPVYLLECRPDREAVELVHSCIST